MKPRPEVGRTISDERAGRRVRATGCSFREHEIFAWTPPTPTVPLSGPHSLLALVILFLREIDSVMAKAEHACESVVVEPRESAGGAVV